MMMILTLKVSFNDNDKANYNAIDLRSSFAHITINNGETWQAHNVTFQKTLDV